MVNKQSYVYTYLKVYENDHNNYLAIWFDLVLNIKIWVYF